MNKIYCFFFFDTDKKTQEIRNMEKEKKTNINHNFLKYIVKDQQKRKSNTVLLL